MPRSFILDEPSELVIYVGVVGTLAAQVFLGVLFGLGKGRAAAILQCATPLIQLIVISLSIYLYGSLSAASVGAILCANALVVLWGIVAYGGPIAVGKPTRNGAVRLLSFELPFFVMSLLANPVALLLTSLIRDGSSGPIELARYGVCIQIASLIVVTSSTIYPLYVGLLTPGQANGPKVLKRLVLEMTAIMTSIYIVFELFAAPVVKLILPSYQEVVPLAEPYVLWGCLLGVKTPLIAFLDGRGKVWISFSITVLGSVFLIGASFVGVRWGTLGLGWARLAGGMLEGILALLFVMLFIKNEQDASRAAACWKLR
jgi:hypothetical protein